MVADLLLVAALCIPVLALGFIVGVRSETGVPGLLLFVVIAALWGLACTGFPYALALKTGNPSVVNSSFLLFFPFTFLTTALVPEQALTPWFRTIAKLNPVTYILAGLRSLLVVGWAWGDIAQALLAILIVARRQHRARVPSPERTGQEEVSSVVGEFGHRLSDLRELAHRLVDDLRDGLHLVDAPDDLTAERERGLHVAAEVEVHRGAELIHADVVFVLESLAALGAQRTQARAARSG